MRKRRSGALGSIGSRILGRALLAGTLVLAAAPASRAVTLSDGGWSAEIDPESTAGVSGWVDPAGVDHLSQEWFWLSEEAGPRTPVSDLGTPMTVVTDTDGDGDDDNLYTRYSLDSLTVEINYRLSEGGTIGGLFAGSLVKTFTISNPLEVPRTFWIYANLDLDGTALDESAASGVLDDLIAFPVLQSNASLFEFDFTPLLLADELATPVYLSDDGSLLDFLENDTDTLPAPGGEVMNGDLSFLVEIEVPGNLSLHFQTPQNLFTPVPEPGTAALLTLGLVGLAWGSRGPHPGR